MTKLSRLSRALCIFGPVALLRIIFYRLVVRHLVPLFAQAARRRLATLLATDDRPIIVIRSTLDLSYPYAQRVQHLARALARAGAGIIYVTPGHGHDRVLTAACVEPGLILTPHLDAALDTANRPTLMLLSTDGNIPESLPSDVVSRGGSIVYDFIDHLDDAVSSHPLTEHQIALHRHMLADEANVTVLATAGALLADAMRWRRSHVVLVTNGVEVDHFQDARRGRNGLRADFAAVLDRGRPILGYFGSFAAWFDYDLVKEAARMRPCYDFVLVGPDLDGTAVGFAGAPDNLFVLPAMRYADLPRHAAWFDAALLPFIVNDITLATSPLKIFEYMALGLPTVSTDLPECRKYSSVLISASREDFAAALDTALKLTMDAGFRATARDEGRANGWEVKAAIILAALKSRRIG